LAGTVTAPIHEHAAAAYHVEDLRAMSAVPGQPIDRDSPVGGARLAQRRQSQPVGWWGMVMFLCSEVTIFGTMIGSYFYLEFGRHHWPPHGIAPEKVTDPSIATGVLVATALPMWFAARAAREGNRRTVLSMIAIALAIQGAFFGVQVALMASDLNHFSPKTTAYGSIYYTLIATHDAHVLLGCLLDLAVFWFVARRGLTNYWLVATRNLAVYWYVINGLAVWVLLTQLSPSL
jgi:heme/copper-type cytochrome/quinol oxidase subunit 3